MKIQTHWILNVNANYVKKWIYQNLQRWTLDSCIFINKFVFNHIDRTQLVQRVDSNWSRMFVGWTNIIFRLWKTMNYAWGSDYRFSIPKYQIIHTQQFMHYFITSDSRHQSDLFFSFVSWNIYQYQSVYHSIWKISNLICAFVKLAHGSRGLLFWMLRN